VLYTNREYEQGKDLDIVASHETSKVNIVLNQYLLMTTH